MKFITCSGQKNAAVIVVSSELLPAFAEVIRRGMAHEHGQPQELYEFNDALDAVVNTLATCTGAHQPSSTLPL